jgi:hypothetical protein
LLQTFDHPNYLESFANSTSPGNRSSYTAIKAGDRALAHPAVNRRFFVPVQYTRFQAVCRPKVGFIDPLGADDLSELGHPE